MTKQTTENRQKQGCEQEQSTKKQTTDNSTKENFQPQQSTSTFLMDIQNQEGKKDKAKKSQKSQDYPPPKKQKMTEEEVKIEIDKHLLTLMAQKLQEYHVNKSLVKPKNQEWKGNTAERKRLSVIYRHIPENLKNLMRQNVELPEEERVQVEEKIVKGQDGSFKCPDCNEKSFQKRREIYQHIRLVHNYTPLMYVCGYSNCLEASNNTTSLGIHTINAHFAYLFKKMTIPIE